MLLSVMLPAFAVSEILPVAALMPAVLPLAVPVVAVPLTNTLPPVVVTLMLPEVAVLDVPALFLPSKALPVCSALAAVN